MKRGTVLGFALAPIIDAGTGAPSPHNGLKLEGNQVHFKRETRVHGIVQVGTQQRRGSPAEAEILYEKEKSARVFFLALPRLKKFPSHNWRQTCSQG
jgi:hypothetical protein